MSYNNPRLKDGFGQSTSTVMRDPAVNLNDKAVYAYLCTFADSKSNQLQVSVFTMASELAVSKQTIIRSLKRLESSQIIKRVFISRDQPKTTIILK
jgi:DNA-binding MarR family transcriptional regulator